MIPAQGSRPQRPGQAQRRTNARVTESVLRLPADCASRWVAGESHRDDA